MMLNPPDPYLESINGDTFRVVNDYQVSFGDWLSDLQFVIPAGTLTDLASIPWFVRWINDRASLGILAPVVHDFIFDRRGSIETLQGKTIQVKWFDANLLFLILLRIDGISWHRSLIAFVGVLIGSPRF